MLIRRSPPSRPEFAYEFLLRQGSNLRWAASRKESAAAGEVLESGSPMKANGPRKKSWARRCSTHQATRRVNVSPLPRCARRVALDGRDRGDATAIGADADGCGSSRL